MRFRLLFSFALAVSHAAANDAPHAEAPPAAAVAAPANSAPAPTASPAASVVPAAPAAPTASASTEHAGKDTATAQPKDPAPAPPDFLLVNAPTQTATPAEIASLLRIGLKKTEQGDFDSAELALMRVLAEQATPEQDHDALIALARMHRKRGQFTKAASIYERIIKDYPSDPDLPRLYLELGRTLRALGAHKQAINRFYSVINSTLKLPEEGPEHYRQLARTAQFEIAETYFLAGDFEQAKLFFSRLKLLDLAPEDRARAHFKSCYALTLSGSPEDSAAALRAYLEQNPRDENVPEARYLLSTTLRKLGQIDEALRIALELLRVESSHSASDPRRWSYWQRKTGNQLANEFYAQGDFGSALLIYQHLAQLSPEPAWLLPVTYQVGLCYERLQLFERAREAYQSIVEKTKTVEGQPAVRRDLADLQDMASWRLKQLDWQQATDRQVLLLLDNGKTPLAKTTDHDHHGSAAKSSHAMR